MRTLALPRFASLVWLAAAPTFAQQVDPPQDQELDNLIHAEGYEPAKPGVLGAVIERGDGPIDMVLVSGFGVGASAFTGFMERNAARYRMFAITLPGFEGTAAPAMPPAATSYGEQTWTRANEPPLPVLIRYLCEFHASDVRADFARLTQPLLLIRPSFPEALRKDPQRSHLESFFEEPWRGMFEARPHTEVVVVPDAGILVMDDQPATVDRAVAGFLERKEP